MMRNSTDNKNQSSIFLNFLRFSDLFVKIGNRWALCVVRCSWSPGFFPGT